jgi:hypothetical protein
MNILDFSLFFHINILYIRFKGIFSQEDWKIVAHYGFLVFVTEDHIWEAIFRVEYSIKQPQAICIPQPQ